MNIESKELRNAVLESLDQKKGSITRELINRNLKALTTAYSSMLKYNYSDEEITSISRHIESIIPHKMSGGQTLKDQSHKSWLSQKKETIDSYYWDRYKHILKKDRSPDVLAKIDIVTDEILDLLQDPDSEGKWIRKGLVVGDVQSGKTGNFIGLVTKAFDAGYKLVIVLSGLLNSLRQQTQERFDQGVIGIDSSIRLKDLPKIKKLVGVGEFNPSNIPITITTVNADFNSKYASENQQALEQYSMPIVFVIKKNVSIIRNLIGWLINNNFNLDQYPLLLIDDESDHASINTNKDDLKPTKTNKKIRELLDLFPKKVYLGYTATPFANIFIDPETPEEMMSDLFPEHFIKVLDAPTNYFGSQEIYVDDESNCLREINDHNDILPIKHKIHEMPEILPPSLEKAVKTFILVCAIRVLRGDAEETNSMLVNVSRFTGIQSKVRILIHIFLKEVTDSIKGNYALSTVEALKNNHLSELHDLFKEEYSQVEFSWIEIQNVLNKAASKIDTIEVNGSKNAEKIIDYSNKSYPHGRSLIAVGGFSLSRGITIEGLSITYFLRNSLAYDTLMQMGRWFGYRPRYEDLCRIYMTNDSMGYYRSIALASEELKHEFKKMASSKPPKTPMDFGLKVRNHEGALLVTARNKMRSSRTIIRSVDLTGQTIETTRVYNDAKFIKRNFNSISNLYLALNEKENHKIDTNLPTKHKLWRGVGVKYVLDFLAQFENHPESPRTDTDLVINYITELAQKISINNWNIVFVNPLKRKNKVSKITLPSPFNNFNASIREKNWSKTSKGIMLSHRSLGSEDINAIDLEEENKDRLVPLLMVHLLEFWKDNESINEQGFVAYGISFPGKKVMGHVKIEASYQVNIRWWNENYGSLQEDDEDLGEEIGEYV